MRRRWISGQSPLFQVPIALALGAGAGQWMVVLSGVLAPTLAHGSPMAAALATMGVATVVAAAFMAIGYLARTAADSLFRADIESFATPMFIVWAYAAVASLLYGNLPKDTVWEIGMGLSVVIVSFAASLFMRSARTTSAVSSDPPLWPWVMGAALFVAIPMLWGPSVATMAMTAVYGVLTSVLSMARQRAHKTRRDHTPPRASSTTRRQDVQKIARQARRRGAHV